MAVPSVSVFDLDDLTALVDLGVVAAVAVVLMSKIVDVQTIVVPVDVVESVIMHVSVMAAAFNAVIQS